MRISIYCNLLILLLADLSGGFEPRLSVGYGGKRLRRRSHHHGDWRRGASSTRRSSSISSDDGDHDEASSQRRRLLSSIPLIPSLNLLSFTAATSLQPAHARGLVMFPCPPGALHNIYHFLRAGESMLEAQDILSTNPLFLTNRNDDALTLNGQEQVVAACQEVIRANSNTDSDTTQPPPPLPTLIVHSLAAASIDTANICAGEFRLGRDRILPEFTFLDPRAIGLWDMTRRSETLPAVMAMDATEAGRSGQAGKPPPPNEDGTPSETLADQAVRLRQELSVLESLYSGDTIMIVFGDGTSPALLSAMMAGIPYNECHELEYAAAEVRFNVTMDRTLELLQAKRADSDNARDYQATLAKGRQTLQELRSGNVINRKDQRMEAERVAIETEYNRQQTVQRLVNEQRLVAKQELRRKMNERQEQSYPSRISPQTFVASAGVLGVVGATAAIAMPKVSAADDDNALVNATSSVPEEAAMVNQTTSARQNAAPPPYSQPGADSRPIRYRSGASSERSAGLVQEINPVDRKALAEQAMQDYLDKDDGADEWLQSLAQIIEEDTELDDEDDVQMERIDGNATSAFQ